MTNICSLFLSKIYSPVKQTLIMNKYLNQKLYQVPYIYDFFCFLCIIYNMLCYMCIDHR